MNMINAPEVRRENLRRWAEKNGIPPTEKSYFSQLLGGASFGERSARRLERDYKMGDGYLDQPLNGSKVLSLVTDIPPPPETERFTDSDEFIELLALYQQSDSKGRQFILKSARVASKGRRIRWIKSDEP